MSLFRYTIQIKPILLFLAFFCAGTLCVPHAVYAAQSEADKALEDQATKNALIETAGQEKLKTDQMIKNFTANVIEAYENEGKVEVNLAAKQKNIKDKEIPFFDFYMDLGQRTIKNPMLEQQLNGYLGQSDYEAFLGKIKIDGSIDNPTKSTTIENDALVLQIYNEISCIPTSVNATTSCAAKAKGKDAPEVQNFVDFFLSEGTWSSEIIDKALIVSRRFIAGSPSRILIGDSQADAANFIEDLTSIARASLRMVTINALAARHAPATEISLGALNKFLGILDIAGGVQSPDYNQTCAQATLTPTERYACSYTVVDPVNKTRIISQAALDRIMQFDLMLSPSFYEAINSPDVNAFGTMDKTETYLKAQQVAQDYRALRLLQMKVATTAMNVINKK